MTSFVELLEGELQEAFEIKDQRSLHRYVMLLEQSLVSRTEYMQDSGSIKSDVALLAESMREGFKRMDERFAAVDKRFEDLIGQMNSRFEMVDKRFEDLIGQMNSRFTMMFTFMTIGFTSLTVLISLFKFVL